MINATVTALLTLLVMAGSLAVGFLSTVCRCDTFFLTICTVLLAELLVGTTVLVQFFNRSKGHVIFSVGAITVCSICYLIFTLLMCIPFAVGASLAILGIWHIAGAVLFIVLIAAFLMASAAFGRSAADNRAAFANKKMYKLEIERFKAENADLIGTSAELAKLIEEISDALQYASDSIPGCESVDAKLAGDIDALHRAAASGSAEACIAAGTKVLQTNTFRQVTIKEMR